ncbi:MAG: hypothetical protein Q9167_007121 [Letrouitia subvulpina]
MTQTTCSGKFSRKTFKISLTTGHFAGPIISTPPAPAMSSSVAPEELVEAYTFTLERQRQAFESERALWNIERGELLKRIAMLKSSLQLHQKASSGKNPLSSENPNSILSRAGIQQNVTGAKHTRADPRSCTERVAYIAENEPPISPTYYASTSSSKQHADSNVKESNIERGKTFDNITFKSNTISASTMQKASQITYPATVLGPPSPLPAPNSIHLPQIQLDAPENLTKNAGHTPLTRIPAVYLDGASSTATSSEAMQTEAKQEQPHLELFGSAAKIPSEQSDSYFPPLEDCDNDPELKGPLNLKNSEPEDRGFLRELNTKLLEVSQDVEGEPSKSSEPKVAKATVDENVDIGIEQPEPEPMLRFKKSLNFGSQLGSLYYRPAS